LCAKFHNADEAHRIIGVARQYAPIAIGPYGPEVLSYELVRTINSNLAVPSTWSRKAIATQPATL